MVKRIKHGSKKVNRNCKRKPCKQQLGTILTLQQQLSDHRKFITELKTQLENEKKATFSAIEHITARTELVKAMGLAMKTCSSALWSDRKNHWYSDDRVR